MATNSAAKSGMIFDVMHRSEGFYNLVVEPKFRSRVNVPFRIYAEGAPNEDLEAKFLKEADKRGLLNLKGHRSVGGLRASLYNALSLNDTKRLVDFMKWFVQEYKLKN